MLEKKLTALSCVAGIVVLGACGSVTAYTPPPPPPPPAISVLEAFGIRSLQLVVKRGDDSHHLDPSELAAGVVSDWRSRRTTVRMKAPSKPVTDSAGLEITILRDGPAAVQSPPPSGGQQHGGQVVWLAAKLTSKDGAVIWRQSAVRYATSCASSAGNAAAWNDPKFRYCVVDNVSRQFVYQLLYDFKGSP